MEKVYREIGSRLRSLRQALKLTQAETAERAGIDASFYGQVERGANVPSLRTLYAVAAVFKIEPSELLPPLRGAVRGDPSMAGAIDSLLGRLKPKRRKFLMSVVRDLADELER